jgi:hypothetical protein
MRRVTVLLPIATLGVALLAGCSSQISALAPVGGDDITSLRIAAIDVLLERKLTIRDAPVCSEVAPGYSCTGSLTDGSAIVVTAPDADATTMTITVGGSVVYEGSVQEVLDRAAGFE